jgi:hypothetical protein
MHRTSHIIAEENATRGTSCQRVYVPLVRGIALTNDQRRPGNDGGRLDALDRRLGGRLGRTIGCRRIRDMALDVTVRRTGEHGIAGHVHKACAGGCRGEGDVHAALGCGRPVRLPEGGIDDHPWSGCADQVHDLISMADIQIPPINIRDGGKPTVERCHDALTGAPRLSRDLLSEKAAATHDEKIHSHTV